MIHQRHRQTDGQTDGQTDRRYDIVISRPRFAQMHYSASRGNNNAIIIKNHMQCTGLYIWIFGFYGIPTGFSVGMGWVWD